MDITERLRELDKSGYQPLTGAIGEEAADEIARLRAEVAELRKDAERYRLVRRLSDPAVMDLLNDIAPNPETPDAFDAAIDAALAKDSSHE